MRHSPALFFATVTVSFAVLRCGGGEETLPVGAGGTGNGLAGRGNMAGSGVGGAAPSGGTTAGRASSGGTTSVSTGGSAGGLLGTGGFVQAGNGGSGNVMSSGAGTGAGGKAGAAGRGNVGFGGAGASGVAGTTSGGSGAGMGGSGSAAFQAVQAIIAANCATSDCHVNSKKQHANFHNTDGMLYERLVSTTTTIVGAKAVCAKDALVIPGNPDGSLIMKMIIADDSGRTDCGKRMPDDCPATMPKVINCLTDADIETIRSWIADGAPR